MLNINRGHNRELMEKCTRLWEYSEFVSEVNENLSKGNSLKNAIILAIDSYIKKGILLDILVKDRADVMLFWRNTSARNLAKGNPWK